MHRLTPCLLLWCGLAGATPPAAHVDLGDDAPHVVVIASVEPGGPLPQSPGCAAPDAFCLHHAPAWYRAHVVDALGSDVPRDLVFTATHEVVAQMVQFQTDDELWLLGLATDGTHYTLSPLDRALARRDRNGALYVPLLRNAPLAFLPCAAFDLRSEIHPDDYTPDMAWRRDSLDTTEPGYDPAFYRVDDTSWWPRQGIPAKTLTPLLASAPGARCDAPDAR